MRLVSFANSLVTRHRKKVAIAVKIAAKEVMKALMFVKFSAINFNILFPFWYYCF